MTIIETARWETDSSFVCLNRKSTRSTFHYVVLSWTMCSVAITYFMRTENSSTFIRPKIGQQTEIAGKFHNSNNACAHIIYIIIYLTLAIRNVLYCLDVVRHSSQPAGQPASVTHSVWSMIFILPVGSSFRQMNEYYVCGWKSHTHTSAICTDDKYGRWH